MSVDTREATAERLLTASVRRSYDPVIEIDWDAPPLPDVYWMPPSRSSLYGTPLWASLSRARQIELTRHEVANAATAGVYFETILIRMLARDFYAMDPRTKHAQYALTEIADECRHSVMFGKLVSALGTPLYRPGRRDMALGNFLAVTARGAHMYSAILIAEEILDAIQREIMADESLQPLIRMVSRIHVVEEARHVKFAREELTRQVEAANPIGLAYARLVIARAALVVSRRFTNPAMYAGAGLDPRVARAAALANPDFRATLRWAGSRVVAYLREHDLIAGPAVALWKKSALI
jgi:hypothetical protein